MMPEPTNLETLSYDELLALKCSRFEDAQRIEALTQIAEVARVLGRRLSATYGPKFSWEQGQVRVYVDDYGHHMQVHVGDREVCSTHGWRSTSSLTRGSMRCWPSHQKRRRD
jgi:hypothetical protein